MYKGSTRFINSDLGRYLFRKAEREINEVLEKNNQMNKGKSRQSVPTKKDEEIERLKSLGEKK